MSLQSQFHRSMKIVSLSAAIIAPLFVFQNCFKIEKSNHSRALSSVQRSDGAAADRDYAAEEATPLDVVNVQAELFVDPSRGNDAGPGSQALPFRTLPRAQQEVRRLIPSMQRNIVVRLKPGTYLLNSPLRLTGEDSGKGSAYVIYKGDSAGSVILSGGKQLQISPSQWTIQDQQKQIYKTSIGKGLRFRQLYVNGQRVARARTRTASGSFQITEYGYGALDDTLSGLAGAQGLELNVLYQWVHFKCPIDFVSGRELHVKRPCWQLAQTGAGMRLDMTDGRGSKVSWIENALSFLDNDEGWFYDSSTGVLYLRSSDSSVFSRSTQLTLPVSQNLVIGSGSTESPVQNIAFSGITFSHSGWTGPDDPQGYRPKQAGYHYRGAGDETLTRIPAAVEFTHAASIRIEDCLFSNLGTTGVYFGPGSRWNQISRNTFRDLAAGAIHIGEISAADSNPKAADTIRVKNHLIQGNSISRTGSDYLDTAGIFVGFTSSTRILENDLSYLPYSGISLGYQWDLSPTVSGSHLIEGNRIQDIMQWMTDGGGIYILGAQPDTVIRDNIVKNLYHSSLYAHMTPFNAGIYLDNGSSGIRVENNRIENIQHNMTGAFSRINQFIYQNNQNANPANNAQSNEILSNTTLNTDPRLVSVAPPTVSLLVNGQAGYSGAAGGSLAFSWSASGATRIDARTTTSYRAGCGAPLQENAVWGGYTGGFSGSYLSTYGANWSGCESAVCLYAYGPGGSSQSCVRLSFATAIAQTSPIQNPAQIPTPTTPVPSTPPVTSPPSIALTIDGSTSYAGASGRWILFSWNASNAVQIEARQTVLDHGGCGAPQSNNAVWGGYPGGVAGSYSSFYNTNWSRCHQAICFYAYGPGGSAQSCVSLQFD